MIQISKYNKQHPLRVFEAFAGYGSQSLAFKYLKEKHPEFDFEVVGFSEIEPSAIQACRLLHGREIPNYGNIALLDWNEVPDFDFISWSSPCQDFSNAGLRKGAEEGSGTRSSLIFQERRMLETKHPTMLTTIDSSSMTFVTIMSKEIIHTAPNGKKYSILIRKYTPRDCFRLMGVHEADIDKLLSKEKTGQLIICKSKLYALAGNSIVTNCLTAMFEELIFPSGNHCHGKTGQLSLF